MKKNEGTFRHSHAPKTVSPVRRPDAIAGPAEGKKTELSQRAQRRLRQSEERRHRRKVRRRERSDVKARSPE